MDQTSARGETERLTASPPLLDDDDPALFPKLTDAQVQMLSRYGEVHAIEAGDVLWGQGESSYDVMVVLRPCVGSDKQWAGGARVGGAASGRPDGRVESFHW